MTTLFDPPYQAHSLTSYEAAREAKPSAATQRAKVLDLLRSSLAAMTDEQMQEVLDMNPSTQRPRRVGLVRMGLVVKHPEKGVTRSGRRADRWMAA